MQPWTHPVARKLRNSFSTPQCFRSFVTVLWYTWSRKQLVIHCFFACHSSLGPMVLGMFWVLHHCMWVWFCAWLTGNLAASHDSHDAKSLLNCSLSNLTYFHIRYRCSVTSKPAGCQGTLQSLPIQGIEAHKSTKGWKAEALGRSDVSQINKSFWVMPQCHIQCVPTALSFNFVEPRSRARFKPSARLGALGCCTWTSLKYNDWISKDDRRMPQVVQQYCRTVRIAVFDVFWCKKGSWGVSFKDSQRCGALALGISFRLFAIPSHI